MSVRPKTTIPEVSEAERDEIIALVAPLFYEACEAKYLTARIDAGVKTIGSTKDWKEYEYTGRRTLTISWRH